jgi:hypothetical protein
VKSVNELVADVAPGEQTGPAIVALLRDDAIEADSAAGEPFHTHVPDTDTVALTAHGGMHDIEAEKMNSSP